MKNAIYVQKLIKSKWKINMKLISRIKNVVDSQEDMLVLDKLKNFPVFMGCVLHEAKDDLCADMTWAISKNTGKWRWEEFFPI